MKKLDWAFLVSLIVLNLSFVNAQELPNSLKAHPRLLFLDSELEQIQQNIKKEKIWEQSHKAIIQEAGFIIEEPLLKREQVGRRLLAISRECLKRTMFLGYAYRLTGEKKYAERVESELLNVATFSDWNPSHFLDVAEMTAAMAIGYDWCFDHFSVPTRLKIQAAILEKGIYPSQEKRYSSWLEVEHNWNQVCNAGMSFGALAIYNDHPQIAQEIIKRSVKSIEKPMIQFAPDGGYPEGYGYWGYGTTFNVMFNDAMEKAFGTDFGLNSRPGFLKTGEYIQHMIGPSLKSFNFSDCGKSISINPATFWFANKTNEIGNIYYDRKLILESLQENIDDRVLPLMMIWGANVSLSEKEYPKSKYWQSGGETPIAVMRTSWEDDAIYVGLKAGSPSVNHAHMDLGSFVMDALGERWSMDFGAQNYHSLESKGINIWGRTQNSQRWDVYRYNNLSHSTLSFDNQFQNVDAHVNITQTSKSEALMAAATDLSKAYIGQVKSLKRSLAIVDQSYVVISDVVINGDRNQTLQWRMLTPANVKMQQKDGFILEQNGKQLTFRILNVKGARLKTWSTDPPKDYDEDNPGSVLIGFELDLTPEEKRNITVVLVPEGEKIPKKVASNKWFD